MLKRKRDSNMSNTGDKMYVWEIFEVSIYNSEGINTLIKDDNNSLAKIKRIIMRYIRENIEECKERLEIFEEHSKDFEHTNDWLDLLQNKLDEVSRHTLMSQFKSFDLLNCNVYVNRVEVI